MDGFWQDRITAAVEDDTVIFRYKRGRTRDLRQHRQAFAVKKKSDAKLSSGTEKLVRPERISRSPPTPFAG
jgi:hypothetical protein